MFGFFVVQKLRGRSSCAVVLRCVEVALGLPIILKFYIRPMALHGKMELETINLTLGPPIIFRNRHRQLRSQQPSCLLQPSGRVRGAAAAPAGLHRLTDRQRAPKGRAAILKDTRGKSPPRAGDKTSFRVTAQRGRDSVLKYLCRRLRCLISMS